MQVARLIIPIALAASGCKQREPDFKMLIPSPDQRKAVIFAGYQPRGTVSGYATLTFKADSVTAAKVATISKLDNGKIGWVSGNVVAIIGDNVKYNETSTSYVPDGTVDSEIILIFCSTDQMDCSSLETKLKGAASTKVIPKFPEN